MAEAEIGERLEGIRYLKIKSKNITTSERPSQSLFISQYAKYHGTVPTITKIATGKRCPQMSDLAASMIINL